MDGNGHKTAEKLTYTQSIQASNRLVLAVWLVYCMTTVGKMALSSAMPEMIRLGLLTKSNGGLMTASFYITYMIGQLYGGTMADRFAPDKLIISGTVGAIICTVAMPLLHSFSAMLTVWCINGIVQFGVWPATVVIVTGGIVKECRKKAYLYIAFAYGIGSAIMYVLAALLLTRFSWHSIFYASSALCALAVLLFGLAYRRYGVPLRDMLPKEEKTVKEKHAVPWKTLFGVGFGAMLFVAFGKTMLSSGLNTWLPTMLIETKNLTTSTSLLLNVLVLIANFFSVFAVQRLLAHFRYNEAKTLVCMYAWMLPFVCGLLFFRTLPVFVTTVFFMVVTSVGYSSGSVMLATYVPNRFADYHCVGTLSGVINAGASFGALVSMYGYGLLADHFGWTGTVYAWILLSVLLFLSVFSILKRWTAFIETKA